MIQRFQQLELIAADAVMAEAYPEAGPGGNVSGNALAAISFTTLVRCFALPHASRPC